jgi:hypothetical protein
MRDGQVQQLSPQHAESDVTPIFRMRLELE